MREWVNARMREWERRSLVFVEDHVAHSTEMLTALAAQRPDLVGFVTVCAIDRAGPDTVATAQDWLRQYPDLQVAAPTAAAERLLPIAPEDMADANAFARLVARLLRPGGILVQDVQLSTLPFVRADRWWESIYLAATVRGMFPDRVPEVRFLSNKRGYAATFGRELIDAGFDPRDVMDKSEVATVVVPTIASLVDRAFPLTLDGCTSSRAVTWPVADQPQERLEIERSFDLVLWPVPDGFELGGGLIDDAESDGHVHLRAGSHEAQTWRALIEDRISAGAGLSVLGVGERIGPAGAERAELTNIAARHVHTLRSRLTDGSAIVTINHTYRISDKTTVGICRKRALMGE
jgi:hypothetical protein